MEDSQYQKYLFHKETFNIKYSIFLDLFEELLKSSEIEDLMCTIKIAKEKIYPARFDLWYGEENCVKNINLIFEFFKKISRCKDVSINYDLLKKILDKKFDLAKVQEVVAGIDIRENAKDSRIKIYLEVKDCPEKIAQILSIHGCNEKIKELLTNDYLAFGIDLYFNGRTGIKIYPCITKKQLENAEIRKRLGFSKKITDLLKECKMLHLSFHGKNFERILHFHPKDMPEFVKLLDSKILTEINNKVQAESHAEEVICLLESEIDRNILENMNIYY